MTKKYRVYSDYPGLWRVMHMHQTDEPSNHTIYYGKSWATCMWIATGDQHYIELIKLADYGRIYSECGARTSEYLQAKKTSQKQEHSQRSR